jgi:hypothetical protein
MGHVRGQQCDQLRLAGSIRDRSYAKAVGLGAALGTAAGSGTDDYVEPAVAEVAGMRPALAAVTDDSDRPLKGCRVRIAIGVDPFQLGSPFRAKKNPRSGRGAGVSGFPVRLNL